MSELWMPGDPALTPSSLHLSLDQFLDEQLAHKRKLYLANGSSWVCKFFAKGECMRGMDCSYRHSRGDKPYVCKFWLRGPRTLELHTGYCIDCLCKKGAETCESLHVYDMSKMPLCQFIADYGACHNADCLFNHTPPAAVEDKPDCVFYARGFCKRGPTCKSRHRKREMCPDYLAGFCELGPSCEKGHPKWHLPVENGVAQYDGAGNLIPGSDQPRFRSLRSLVGMALPQERKGPQSMDDVQCLVCKQMGHMAGACPSALSANEDNPTGRRTVRNLNTVQCFRCGDQGHYASFCKNERKEPPPGGWVLPDGTRPKERPKRQREHNSFLG